MIKFFLLVIAILVLWITTAVFLPYFWDVLTISEIFEGINSLFAGLAFAGIIYTIFLQRNELRLQRKELKETREELKRSADAQERSETIMAKTAEIGALSQLFKYYQTAYNSSSATTKGKYVKKMNEIKRKINVIVEDLDITSDDNSMQDEVTRETLEL